MSRNGQGRARSYMRERPVDEALFAGVMDYSKLPLLSRLMMRLMGIAEGDFRDWDLIRGWATNLYPTLVGV